MSGINIYVILRCCGSGRNRKGNEKHTINLVIELNEKIIKNRKNSDMLTKFSKFFVLYYNKKSLYKSVH